MSVLGAAAYAAAPEAGSVIGNQAVATYLNDAGDKITVTSNKVETVVQQVAGVTLTSDNTESIAPGGKAFLPHIVTNAGNGPDAFSLVALEDNTGAFDATSLVFYPDANMDGVADSATPINETPVLAPGDQFGFVIEATAPSNATANDSDTITVTSTSLFNGSVNETNTDTLTVSSDAIMEVVKSMTVDPGVNGIVDSGDTVTIKLTYSSTGLVAANNYAVQDILDSRLIYDTGSAQWSDSAGTLNDTNDPTLVDGTNGGQQTIKFDASGQTVGFTISSVPSGRSGSVTFTAKLANDIPSGTVPNTATQTINNVAAPPSNTASVEVDAQYNVQIADTAINPDGSPDATTASANDSDGLNNDVVTNSTDAYQGATIPFEFVITNLSNQTDSFALDVSNVDFPPGTTFRIVQADGATPVVGTVGPIASGDTTKVTLLATLPTDETPVPTTQYTANIVTTSQASGVSDNATAEFTGALLAAAVDLENAVVGSEGDLANPTNAGNPWVTNTTDPGQATSFQMKVENNGPTSDSYNLSLAQPLPAGWTVEYRLLDGTIVTNTGTIPAGGAKNFTVIVTPAETAAPGDTLIDIQVSSSVSGQGDRIVNQVTVNRIIDAAITADQVVQASPGGIVDMVHTITNKGNVAITEGDILQSGLNNFSGAVYWDQNGNGALDAGEPVIDNFNDLTDNIAVGQNGLAPAENISVIYRVQTPGTATPGLTEIGTVQLDSAYNGAADADADTADNAVEDRITIISGDVTLTKYQYVDPLCDGTVGTWSKQPQDVEPGQCVRYLIEAENTGTSNAANVQISDVAPAYTAIHNCGGSCAPSAYPAPPNSTITATGTTISSDHNTVIPGDFARLEFTVKVDQ
jgi:uncharacterized repeat protein (TIGR01451 family)